MVDALFSPEILCLGYFEQKQFSKKIRVKLRINPAAKQEALKLQNKAKQQTVICKR